MQRWPSSMRRCRPMSEDGGYYQLHNIMTTLAVRVGQLEGTVKTFMENWTTQDKLAHDSRRIVFERIELLSRQVDRIASDVQGMQQDIAEMKKEVEEDVMPAVDSFNAGVQQRVGAKGVWGMLIGAAMALAGMMAWAADKIVTHFWPKS